ncbi:MAG TPA: SOS response-associated peptidase [Alphaproteobacteria bacterium]|nr:SOS response-associated peptidase [Alphaproteobacteria bacterium]
MCSRYSQTKAPAELAKRFKARQPKSNLQPRYNIAPTQEAPVLRLAEDGGREISLLRWGLVPSWAMEIAGAPLINARSETLAEKASFKQGFERRRCLVLADGFYEWQKLGKEKLPWRFLRQDGEAFAMAGLWDVWQPPQGPALESFTIVTTSANDLVAPVHDRMPVIFPDEESAAAWLERPVADLLRPCPTFIMDAYRIGPAVGNFRNDDESVLAPALV